MPATRLADLIVDSTNSSDATTNRAIIEVVGAGASGLLGPVRLQDGAGAALANVNVSGADAQASQFSLDVIAQTFGWNGAAFDRVRSASAANLAAQSGLGALLAAAPGQWNTWSLPAAGTMASAARPGAGAGIRNIVTGVTFTWVNVAQATAQNLQIVIRDGVSGTGPTIWAGVIGLGVSAGTTSVVSITGLNLPGTANTTTTAEFSAGVASTVQAVTLTGYMAS